MTTTTSSTIDLILVSDIDEISQSSVIDIGISDHSLIFCTRKQTKAVFNKHNSMKLRSLKHYNREEFIMNILNTDWTSVMCSENVIDAWSRFKSIFLSEIDNIAPIREVRIKNRTESWTDSAILHSINERDKAYQTLKGNSQIKLLLFLKNAEIEHKL